MRNACNTIFIVHTTRRYQVIMRDLVRFSRYGSIAQTQKHLYLIRKVCPEWVVFSLEKIQTFGLYMRDVCQILAEDLVSFQSFSATPCQLFRVPSTT